eukprot:TRINITY_DN3324_c0_g1_i1.p1 TRINITY_DN3324_c0_g1~~TRINITY_DN3324_c0_g1_i1.p1  ORF type:complete len:310 (-),score=32.71 TRINITY_DN3324_c0_g1_i1:124-1029(-)
MHLMRTTSLFSRSRASPSTPTCSTPLPFLQRRACSYQNPYAGLKGKVALITGSTSGIGAEYARALASNGVHVMLNGFGDIPSINSYQDELRQYGVKVGYSDADMSKPTAIKQMVADAQKSLGSSPDIVVNNAGIQHVTSVASFPEDKWEQVLAVNLSSSFYTAKYCIPEMQTKGWGRIINTSSVHGLVGSVEKSAYVAAKHGMTGLTKTIALELAGSGVTANCINPGWVLTPLVQKQVDKKAETLGISNEEAIKVLLAEKQPSKQFVTAQQLAGALLFLCSPAADGITGINLPVDGGWTAQ